MTPEQAIRILDSETYLEAVEELRYYAGFNEHRVYEQIFEAMNMGAKALRCLPVVEKRLKHLLQSDVICSFDRVDLKTKEYSRDIKEADKLIEQKQGTWEMVDSYVWDSDCMWRCSECKEELYFEYGTPLECKSYYCPNCGAKMVSETKLEEEE